jgi:hypothetical protein
VPDNPCVSYPPPPIGHQGTMRQPLGTRPARPVFSAWYFLVPIISFGLLAVVPFVHAAARLQRRAVWRLVAIYGVVDAALIIALGVAPVDEDGNATSAAGDVVMTFVVLGALITLIAACVQLAGLRRSVYGATPAPVAHPAVATALAARARRDEARQLAARDPMLARDLLIGRPDLARGYDDGGLVDLNRAPAPTIALGCGLDEASAQRIVDARRARGGFASVDEVIVLVDVPVDAWEGLRDRGIVIG